jgi:hypothetical protein
MADEGVAAEAITARDRRSAETVRRQPASYARDGLAGLRGRANTVRPLTHGQDVPRTVDRVGMHACAEHARGRAA